MFAFVCGGIGLERQENVRVSVDRQKLLVERLVAPALSASVTIISCRLPETKKGNV